ncbi:MAG: hypothetical protein PVH54_13200, partial [Gammaproteobacteria bacterium]
MTQDREVIGAVIAVKRPALQQAILECPRQLIDRSALSLKRIQRVNIIGANTEMAIVNAKQVNEVRNQARSCQWAI